MKHIYSHRVMLALSIATAVMGAMLLLIVAFWLLYPYDPIDQTQQPFPVIFPAGKTIRQGGVLLYRFHYVKKSPVIPVINRQFVDGLVFNAAGNVNPTVTRVGKGVAFVQVRVPETLPPGKYHLHITATYQMNPLRVILINSETEEFQVVPSRDNDLDPSASKN